MGQYWLPVNLDKREFIHPHKLGSGLKLWEQLANDPGTGCALVAAVIEHELDGKYVGEGWRHFKPKSGGPEKPYVDAIRALLTPASGAEAQRDARRLVERYDEYMKRMGLEDA